MKINVISFFRGNDNMWIDYKYGTECDPEKTDIRDRIHFDYREEYMEHILKFHKSDYMESDLFRDEVSAAMSKMSHL